MSSIFTYNPSPPKPASPWANSPSSTPKPSSLDDDPEQVMTDVPGHLKASARSRGSFVGGGRAAGEAVPENGEAVRGLAAEPQIGPTEYKLSLVRGGKSEQRIEQLTTQLLWRLQQSTSYVPTGPLLSCWLVVNFPPPSYHGISLTSKSPEALSSLLQESKGALYEIGLADDGTFVGLDEAELEASLDVLRTIAEKLGAYVTVTRKVYIKTVEQPDVELARAKLAEHLLARARSKVKSGKSKLPRHLLPDPVDPDVDVAAEAEGFRVPKLGSKLYVAEALIKPYDGTRGAGGITRSPSGSGADARPTQQLRISLTGPTMCGKTTLLGTLTTGDLDNGRGKSRLSLLRHRHELVSGVTSSVAWGIVGYKPSPDSTQEDCADDPMSRVVNYATGNISSWTDIHSAAEGGRIVFMSDSAGQLKYRRTTVRSLVGWAPHYAALLIPANDCETKDAKKPGLSEDSLVHMELCIKLDLPLMVVFTKIDIASKPGLRAVLSATLSKLKARGKRPLMLQNSQKIRETVDAMAAEPEVAVPIVFASSVKGDGINLLHDLLMELALPKPPAIPCAADRLTSSADGKDVDVRSGGGGGGGGSGDNDDDGDDDDEAELDAEMTTLFHVEEVYGMKPSVDSDQNSGGSVISGHVRHGSVSIGDKLIVGPFNSGSGGDQLGHRSRSATPTPTSSTAPSAPSLPSAPGLLSRSPESGDEVRGASPPSGRRQRRCSDFEEEEWRLVRVVSVRRLRLPVTSLCAGEAGTVGIIPIEDESSPPSPVVVEVSEATSGVAITTATTTITTTTTTTTPTTTTPIDIVSRGGSPLGGGDKKAVSFASPPPDTYEPEELRLKKGLVLLNCSTALGRRLWMKAYTGFAAELDDDEAAAQSLVVGSDVVVYIASVRAVARIASVDPEEQPRRQRRQQQGQRREGPGGARKAGDDVFSFDDHQQRQQHSQAPMVATRGGCSRRRFRFEFLGVEWMAMGAKVLVMKNQGHSGMEVFVGRVVGRVRDAEV